MKNHRRKTLLSGLSKGLFALPMLCLTASCADSDFDTYYERPGWLESPAFDVLKSRSDCKTYLQMAERTLFNKQLEGSGSYTFFVPTDQAFEIFFASNPYGYKSINDIPDDVIAAIVSSTMLYNQYPCDSLGNKLVGYNTWEAGVAYKHRTPAYEVLHREVVDGDSAWVYDSPMAAWNEEFHNYRYLPVFSELYFKNNGLAQSDYNWFYPQSTWSKYGNVLDAQVLEVSNGSGDLYCENGVVHLIDKVVMPLKNIDRMVDEYGKMDPAQLPAEAKDGAWASLRQIVNHKTGAGQLQFLDYEENTTAKHYFELMYPNYDFSKFYLRGYNRTTMSFDWNYESYSGRNVAEGDDSYNAGITLYVPTQKVMNDYVNGRLLAYVENKEDWDKAFNELPEEVLENLLASLQTGGIIWPSQFKNAQNCVGANEFVGADKKFSEMVEHSAFASNGLYHIVNTFPKTAAFEGVSSRMLLDPAYSLNKQILTGNYPSVYNDLLKSYYSNEGQSSYALILNNNQNLNQWCGLYYDAVLNKFNTSDDLDVTSNVNTMATRSLVERDTTDRVDFEVDPLNGAYGGWGFATTYAGDIIRYKKSGRMVEGKPEIMVQSSWSLLNDTLVYQYANCPTEQLPTVMPQTLDPTPEFYTSIIKDPTYDKYINGNVYTVNENSVPLYFGNITANGLNAESYSEFSTGTGYLTWYLRCDSVSANPRHTIFKQYWDRANSADASQKPGFGSGYVTVLVPTDEALQDALDRGLLPSLEEIKRAASEDVNWADSCAQLCNVYIITTDCFPDDGAAHIYSGNIWSNGNNLIEEFPVSTSFKPLTEEWEDFMSGTTKMGMYFRKAGADHKLSFIGRDHNSGIYTAARVLNASDVNPAKFDNTVIRELGQSNVITPKAMIHSFNGYVIYKIQPNPTKQH